MDDTDLQRPFQGQCLRLLKHTSSLGCRVRIIHPWGSIVMEMRQVPSILTWPPITGTEKIYGGQLET